MLRKRGRAAERRITYDLILMGGVNGGQVQSGSRMIELLRCKMIERRLVVLRWRCRSREPAGAAEDATGIVGELLETRFAWYDGQGADGKVQRDQWTRTAAVRERCAGKLQNVVERAR